MRAAFGVLLIACGGAAPAVVDAGRHDAGVTVEDAGTSFDAGAPDSGVVDAGRPPVCSVTAAEVKCPMSTLAVPAIAGVMRDVNYQLPSGTAPAAGWPVVVLFQGSFARSALFFSAKSDATFGMYWQVLMVARLLDAGYAVLAPEAHLGGNSYWDTNTLPWAIAWDGAPDDVFMKSMFAAIEAGKFGPLKASGWFAAGISSGGYMSSRMAVSYPGKFAALVVHSAGYATCGPVCSVPALPADHPPTLFLHGGKDPLAPPGAMREYHAALVDGGFETRMVVDEALGHEWLPVAPDEVLGWVTGH